MQSEQKQKFEGQLHSITNGLHPDENSDPVLSEITDYFDESDINVPDQLKITNEEHRPAWLKEILQAIFMADHDAAQLEQYLLENDRRADVKEGYMTLAKSAKPYINEQH